VRPRSILTLAAVVVAAVAGCSPGPMSKPGRAAAPMNNPVPLGSDAGSGTVEAARQQFFGTWDLVTLEASPERGGARQPITASGTLVYDEFANLTIDAHTTDADAPVAAREVNLVTFKGRAVIDVPRSELKLMALTGNVDPNEVLAPDRRRRYEFTADLLKLTSFDAQGNVTAISTWRRRK
jgi:hypothetical protein